MKLSHLIQDVSPMTGSCIPDLEVTGIRTRAQEVTPGDLFVAIKGFSADGHDFIDLALKNGAVAVLARETRGAEGCVLRVADTRKAAALAAARFYGTPSDDLTLIGVTGTNGKTTITYLLESMLTAAGLSCGVIGTVDIRYPGQTLDTPVTTPDAVVLQQTLWQMKQAGVTHVVMEVSSHGLAQYRVEGCAFNAGIFTNLTQDHLDFHGSMDDYFNCKKRFFTDFLGPGAKGSGTAVVNLADPYGQKLSAQLNYDIIGVSARHQADIWADGITDTIRGLSGTIMIRDTALPFASPLTGAFNLENILCAAGAAHCIGLSPRQILAGLNACEGAPGRMEKVPGTLNRHLFVDYAHTPDALASVLETLKKRAPKRLITVFGCGGDRDPTKRPVMGRMAMKFSDVAIVTSDNPRTEDPERIVDDIIGGIKADGGKEIPVRQAWETVDQKGYIRQTDRKKALELAVGMSRPSDIIVAAGKGHETYQITNTGTIHFDDREELAAACGRFERRFTPMAWTLRDVARALETDPFCFGRDIQQPLSGVSTDSRTIKSGELFVALTGERFDGHTFIPGLIERGVQAFVVQNGFVEGLDEELKSALHRHTAVVFETDNTLGALGCLARYHRLRAGVKVVAITGSNGKTTTRQMTGCIFETAFETLSTRGNLNNEIGVPLTLLKLSAAHEWAVIEMGMNHAKEMSRLSAIALPDIAVVTNTAGAHLQGLATTENVAKAKAEIFESVRDGGTAIIYKDDPRAAILTEAARSNPCIREIVFFGSDGKTQFSASRIRTREGRTDFTADLNGRCATISIHSPARFMVNNALAASAAAAAAGIDAAGIRDGLLSFYPVAGRMDIFTPAWGRHIIDDTYNANPESVAQALATLADRATASGTKAIAVLGDMLELGSASGRLHWQTGKKAAQLHIDALFLFGPQSAHTRDGALENGMAPGAVHHLDKDAIAQKVSACTAPGDWILVKGSRGMAMETIINTWKEA